MKQQGGFTLIELVVVIVVLGILAAVAVPRFINVQTEARVAVMQGLAGSVASAANLAHAKWIAAGSTGTTVDMDGTSVNVSTAGYPTLATGGIDAAIKTVSNNVALNATGFNYTGKTSCKITYNETNGDVDPTAVTTANCS